MKSYLHATLTPQFFPYPTPTDNYIHTPFSAWWHKFVLHTYTKHLSNTVIMLCEKKRKKEKGKGRGWTWNFLTYFTGTNNLIYSGVKYKVQTHLQQLCPSHVTFHVRHLCPLASVLSCHYEWSRIFHTPLNKSTHTKDACFLHTTNLHSCRSCMHISNLHSCRSCQQFYE